MRQMFVRGILTSAQPKGRENYSQRVLPSKRKVQASNGPPADTNGGILPVGVNAGNPPLDGKFGQAQAPLMNTDEVPFTAIRAASQERFFIKSSKAGHGRSRLRV